MVLAAAQPTNVLIIDLLVILASAGVVAIAMRRFRLPTVPAYLLAGLVLGPGGLELIDNSDEVRSIGDLAIALLMFGVGMHLDWRSLKRRWQVMAGAGAASVVASTGVLVLALLALGINPPVAIALAMALSLSSTAVVARLLYAQREHTRAKGQLALGVLIVQDIAVFAMLLALPSLALWNGSLATLDTAGGATAALVAKEIAVGTAALIGLVVVGRFVLPRLLDEASRTSSDEVMIVIATAFAIGAAALGAISGIGPELGAFLAGILLGQTTFKHHISGHVGTLRDLFIAVFFTTFGMYLDADVLFSQAHIIIGATIGLIVIKSAAIAFGCWVVGAPPRLAVGCGFLLAQAGEFSLVIVLAASSTAIGLIDTLMLQQTTAVVAISIAIMPLLARASSVAMYRITSTISLPWVRSSSLHEQAEQSTEPRTIDIVAGYGVVGRAAAQALATHQSDIRVIDMNPITVRTGREDGSRFIYGDMGSMEVLEEAGITDARLLILTAPDLDAMERSCRSAKRMNPDVRIIARAAFEGQCERLHSAGADEVIVEEVTLAVALEHAVMNVLSASVQPESLQDIRDTA
jgi:CPA2 family monovalent cation:H+ antiporter-2